MSVLSWGVVEGTEEAAVLMRGGHWVRNWVIRVMCN